MKRLTWRDKYDRVYADMNENEVIDYDGANVLSGSVVERLAAYEETEREPNEFKKEIANLLIDLSLMTYEVNHYKRMEQELLDMLAECEAPTGDDSETYTTGYRNGYKNGRASLIRYILRKPEPNTVCESEKTMEE